MKNEASQMNNSELWNSVTNTISIEADSIASLVNSLSQEAVIKTIELIGNCKGKVIVAGCGTSAAAARKIAHSLCCVERPAAYLNPADAVHGALGLLQKEDIFILISKGGNTGEIINMIPACQAKGAKLIGVTENPESVLAKESDIILKVKVEKEPCPFNMLATASTMAVIAAFDAICIALMHYTNYTKEQFAVIHPKGAVGDRLTKGMIK
jgi:KpsF/GutQ family protein